MSPSWVPTCRDALSSVHPSLHPSHFSILPFLLSINLCHSSIHPFHPSILSIPSMYPFPSLLFIHPSIHPLHPFCLSTPPSLLSICPFNSSIHPFHPSFHSICPFLLPIHPFHLSILFFLLKLSRFRPDRKQILLMSQIILDTRNFPLSFVIRAGRMSKMICFPGENNNWIVGNLLSFAGLQEGCEGSWAALSLALVMRVRHPRIQLRGSSRNRYNYNVKLFFKIS